MTFAARQAHAMLLIPDNIARVLVTPVLSQFLLRGTIPLIALTASGTPPCTQADCR